MQMVNKKSAALAAMFFFLTAGTALAHEKRSVSGIDMVVGFVNEPAYSQQFNGIDLRVSRDGKPVEGLESTMKAAVLSGDASREFALRPRHKEPGRYAAYFIPSKAGHYAFRFEGQVGSAKIDETFRTEDGKFSPVADSDDILFP